MPLLNLSMCLVAAAHYFAINHKLVAVHDINDDYSSDKISDVEQADQVYSDARL